MFPQVEIVSGPSESAGVVASLNDEDSLVRIVKSIGGQRQAFDLGYAGDDNTVRPMVFGLAVVGSLSRGAAVAAFSRVARAASTPGRWLHVKMAHDDPSTWFKLNPKSAGDLDFDRVYLDDRDSLWSWDLELEAVGPGYGERVTLPAMTISNADLGATIPQEIAGDYPTAARIDVRPLGVQSWGGWRSLVNVTPVLPSCPLGAPGAAGVVVASPLPPVITWEAEAFTPSAGTTVHTSGGLSGGQALKFDETDGTWRPILSGTVPVNPPPGTYQVWARVWRSSLGAGGAQLRIGHFSWTQDLDIRTAKFNPPAGESHISWIVLGEMSFPAGMPTEGLTGDDLTVPRIWVWGKGLSLGGAGGIILIDRFALVPRQVAQGGKGVTALATWDVSSPAAFVDTLWNGWRIDGDYRRTGLIQYDRKWFTSATPPQWAGGYPTLSPGMRNIVTVLHRTNQTGEGSDDMSKSVEVVISYHPRVAHLAS